MPIKIASMNFGDCDTILRNTPNGMKNIAEVLGPNGEVYWSAIKELTGVLPLSIRSNGTMLLDYLISGNMSQTGTPTPTTPIQPQETGERTGNLYPLDASKLHIGRIENDGTIDYETGTLTVGPGSVTYEANTAWRGFYTDFIQVNEKEKLTISSTNSITVAFSCSCYDENDNFLGKATSHSTSTASTRTFTLLTGTEKVRVSATSSDTTYTILRPMLNSGSTPLPYEPYGYKLDISSSGENLINPNRLEAGYLNVFGDVSGQGSDYLEQTSDFIPVTGSNYSWTLSEDWGSRRGWVVRCFYNESKEMIGSRLGGNTTELSGSFAVPPSAAYVRISWRSYGTIACMLSLSATALPYEPYIEPNETNIYLSEVETTRRIGKLVLTGSETFFRDKERADSWGFYSDILVSGNYNLSICSHFVYIGTSGVNNTDNIGFSLFNTSQFGCRCPKSIADTVNKFKAWLANQYAAGTPITVWYVLATPETAVVNEPLRKIGDHADTVSYEQAGVQIPTNRGNTVIDVETTLKPSQMYIKYK